MGGNVYIVPIPSLNNKNPMCLLVGLGGVSPSLRYILCKCFIGTFCRVVATSQMQATYARKTFPCFDEPALKAVFNVTIIHDPDTVALSNGMEIGSLKKFRNSNPFLIFVPSQIYRESGSVQKHNCRKVPWKFKNTIAIPHNGGLAEDIQYDVFMTQVTFRTDCVTCETLITWTCYEKIIN